MLSTMQDQPLTITSILRHGSTVHAGSEVATWTGSGARRARFEEIAVRAARLAGALRRMGIKPGDRVGTFAWNVQEHLEAYLAVPCYGAVLHTLNIRLVPEQVAWIANHAEDRVIVVEDSLVPALAPVAALLKTVERFVVTGSGDASALGPRAVRYEDLLAQESGDFDWPELDERSAAGMCYTSGTTGNPKGVVYSHRSTVLHAMAMSMAANCGIEEHDRVLEIVPLFHANGWGLVHVAFLTGADLILPGRFLQAEALCRMIAAERPTFAGAVPTIWNDILRLAETTAIDLSSLERVVCGGSAVPRALMEKFQERYGVRIIQAWGMTETSPLGAIARPPKGTPADEEMDWRSRTGRVVYGVEARIVHEEKPQPWDGASVGEIEVRGPWVTGSYYQDDDPAKFHDGWLRTGDVGTIDARGFVQISDRAKDVIKSGGEWISSVELEVALMAHPDVREAAVIGVPDERWGERPLACVVFKDGAKTTFAELKSFLASRVARWWLPERWAAIPEVPRTSVGKFDKKALRARHAAGGIDTREA